MEAKSEETSLVRSCLEHRPFAWQQFVDRYLPVVLQSIQEFDVQTNQSWTEKHREEIARHVFDRLRKDDFDLLRRWDPDSNFDTFLVIATRRIVFGAREE